MRSPRFTWLLASAIVPLFTNTAHAQDYTYAEEGPRPTQPLYTTYGLAVTLGGGIQDFSYNRALNTTGLAGTWNLRVELGSAMPISVEAIYTGSAQSINALNFLNDGTLIGTNIEGDVKWNISTGTEFRPFLFAGLGWLNYQVTGGNFNLSDDGVNSSDNSMTIPFGGGLRYNYKGIDADIRFTYRPVVFEGLILSHDGDADASLDTWSFGANVGAQF